MCQWQNPKDIHKRSERYPAHPSQIVKSDESVAVVLLDLVCELYQFVQFIGRNHLFLSPGR